MRNLKLIYNIITHKFYSGQGLHLNMSLTKRNYNLKIQTIWEDYALLEIQGLSGIKNYILKQQGLKGEINDQQLQENHQQQIDMILKLPQYSSYEAKIYGSINHIAEFVDSKLRGPVYSIDVISKGSQVNLKYIQAQKLSIRNSSGKVSISTLICGEATIQSLKIDVLKIMINKNLKMRSGYGYIRSLLLQNSQATLDVLNLRCESIQGKASIKSQQKLIVNRWYAGPNQIAVESKDYKITIENGSGIIKGTGILELGQNHKGTLKEISSTEKQII